MPTSNVTSIVDFDPTFLQVTHEGQVLLIKKAYVRVKISPDDPNIVEFRWHWYEWNDGQRLFYLDFNRITAPLTISAAALLAAIEAMLISQFSSSIGTYTPTAANNVNLDANPSVVQAFYTRIFNHIYVTGRFGANPTAAGATSFTLTLPVASNLATSEDLGGVAFSGSIAGLGAEILGDFVNNLALVKWIAVDVTNKFFSYQFSYRVI